MALRGCNLHGTGGILHGHERTCKICSIFMPRLDIDPSQVLSRSHGKSWQDLENFFLRVCVCVCVVVNKKICHTIVYRAMYATMQVCAQVGASMSSCTMCELKVV